MSFTQRIIPEWLCLHTFFHLNHYICIRYTWSGQETSQAALFTSATPICIKNICVYMKFICILSPLWNTLGALNWNSITISKLLCNWYIQDLHSFALLATIHWLFLCINEGVSLITHKKSKDQMILPYKIFHT